MIPYLQFLWSVPPELPVPLLTEENCVLTIYHLLQIIPHASCPHLWGKIPLTFLPVSQSL